MERLLDAKIVMCPKCGNTVQIFDTAELAADLTRLAEYDRMIKSGEMVKVVRCKECVFYGGCMAQTIPSACCDGYCSQGTRRDV